MPVTKEQIEELYTVLAPPRKCEVVHSGICYIRIGDVLERIKTPETTEIVELCHLWGLARREDACLQNCEIWEELTEEDKRIDINKPIDYAVMPPQRKLSKHSKNLFEFLFVLFNLYR